jgi:hypothetical protein
MSDGYTQERGGGNASTDGADEVALFLPDVRPNNGSQAWRQDIWILDHKTCRRSAPAVSKEERDILFNVFF